MKKLLTYTVTPIRYKNNEKLQHKKKINIENIKIE